MGRAHPPAVDEHGPDSSVLVVSPALDAFETVEHVDEVRSDGETGPVTGENVGGAPATSNHQHSDQPLVIVSRAHTAESLLEAWRSTIGDFPRALGIISIGELTRSVAAGAGTVELPQAHIRTVGAEDVTGVGIAIGEMLSQYDDDQTPILWFESLTPMVEHKGLEMTFRFLHVTLEQISRSEAVAYVHVDASELDDQTVTTLGHLFDDVVELEA